MRPRWRRRRSCGCSSPKGRLAEAVEALESGRAVAGDRGFFWLVSEFVHSDLGEYLAATEPSTGVMEAVAWIALGREDEGLGRVRGRLEISPGKSSAEWGLLHGLSLAGRHQELLEWWRAAARAVGAGLTVQL
jgi:hypothetical protein